MLAQAIGGKMNDAVLDTLNKYHIPFTVSGRDYVTYCLNPDHEDNNPSFRIDKTTGVAHCFSCGFKTNIFKHFGVFTNPVPIRVAKLKEKLQDIKQAQISLEYPKGYTPYTKQFRGISTKTLKQFDAFYTYYEEDLVDRIVFPIKDISGKIVLFVGRHLRSNAQPKYRYFPVGVKIPIFPSKLPSNTNSVVLVEGLFDMLNLYDKGVHNVICCFGTNTLQKDIKDKLMPLRAQGVSKVYLLFDGDDAGRKAMQTLKPLIEQLEFAVEIIDLPNGLDPGELDQDMVNEIKQYIQPNTL